MQLTHAENVTMFLLFFLGDSQLAHILLSVFVPFHTEMHLLVT